MYALIEITEKIRKTIDSRKYGCGIFIDLRKAFDTVNHEILLMKLEHYGIRGNMLKWFQSYLTNRKQFVSVNNTSSELKDIKCGVPQGSVLGPLLFLLYVNDLPNVSSLLNFYLFSDDTNISYESNSLKDLEKTLNIELNKLYLWLNLNRLSLNYDKTNYIIFHTYNKPIKQYITIKINKKAIAEKKSIKYLGVLIDSTLSWKQHISNVSKKISRTLGVMYKLRIFLPLSVMKSVYYSLIYSHIIYAIEVWGSTFKTEIDKILVLQKRAMRIMTFNDQFPVNPGPLCPSNPIFLNLGTIEVDDIFNYQICKFIFKSLNDLTPVNFRGWFKFSRDFHNHNTKMNYNMDNKTSNNYLVKHSARTINYGYKLLKVNGPRIWNELPHNIINQNSLSTFLKHLKSHYLSKYQ